MGRVVISFSRERGKQNWFYFSFILWYATEIIFRSKYGEIIKDMLPEIENYIAYTVLGLMLIQIFFFQKYQLKEILIIAVISILIITTAIFSGQNYLLSAWIFIVGSKYADIDKIIRIAYKILLLLIPVIILSNLTGIIPDVIMYRGNVVRHSLGFAHPNSFGLCIFQFMLCYCYIRWHKIKWYDLAFIVVGAVFIKIVSDSQTAAYGLIILVCMTITFKLLVFCGRYVEHIFCKVLQIISLALASGSIFLSSIDLQNFSILKDIDRILSLRFTGAHRVFNIYGETWLGNKIFVSETERELVGLKTVLYLDNAYCTLWLRFGIAMFVFFIFAYLLLYNRLIHYPLLIMILFMYSVYGVMEGGLIQMRNNVFLLLFSYLLYPQKSLTEIMQRQKKL